MFSGHHTDSSILHPPDVPIHRPVKVTIKGKYVTCYGGIDKHIASQKMKQALVNMKNTFMMQLPPVMLRLNPKQLKESLRQLRQVCPGYRERRHNNIIVINNNYVGSVHINLYFAIGCINS